MRAISRFIVVFAGLLFCMGNAGIIGAEMNLFDLSIEGEAELAWRVFLDRPSEKDRGYFEEYRDIPPGIFLENLHLLILNKDESFLHELIARDAAEDDQYYFFRSSMVGVYDFRFEWDQIPHTYSTRSPLDDHKISTQWDTARFSLDYTPTPEWDVLAEYTFIDKHGDIPKGSSESPFRPPDSAFDFNEFRQPVQYSQHDMTLSTSFAQKPYQLQMSYNLSLFEDDMSFVRDPQGNGRLALPPDNLAHTITLAGGANLPYRTRINGTFSYGLRLQDDSNFQGLAMPDFNGEVNTYLANLYAVSRPVDPLTVKGMYRYYRYDDDSNEILSRLNNFFEVLAVRFPYSKHNASLDAKWQFPWPISVSAGYYFERWDREESLESGTDEHTPRISLNATPFDWLSLGASYSHSSRIAENDSRLTKIGHVTPNTFIHSGRQNCLQCHLGQLTPIFPLFTNFNMTDRERDKVELLAEFTPLNNLTFTINYGLAQNEYDARFGLQDDDEWSVGADITWRPLKRLALNVNYQHQELETRIRSDNRFLPIDIDAGPPLLTEGPVETVGAGATLDILPEKLALETKWMMSMSSTDFNNRRLPDLDETYSQYSASVRYNITKHWIAKVGYIFEDFDISDAYARNVQPQPGNEFLTSDYYDDFTAHMLVLGLAYRF